MSFIIDLSEKFKVSKPVFVRESDNGDVDNTEIRFVVKESYSPVDDPDLDLTDPVVKLMVSNYNEQFSSRKRAFEKSGAMISNVVADMHASIKHALCNASPLKNPEQSKLYKWFNSDVFRPSHKHEALVALYRYIYANTDDKFQYNDGSSNPHAKNLIAILEKVREKNERK